MWSAGEATLLARGRDVFGFDPCGVAAFMHSRHCDEVRRMRGPVNLRRERAARVAAAHSCLWSAGDLYARDEQVYAVLAEQDSLAHSHAEEQVREALEKETALRSRKKRRRAVNREVARKRALSLKKGSARTREKQEIAG